MSTLDSTFLLRIRRCLLGILQPLFYTLGSSALEPLSPTKIPKVLTSSNLVVFGNSCEFFLVPGPTQPECFFYISLVSLNVFITFHHVRGSGFQNPVKLKKTHRSFQIQLSTGRLTVSGQVSGQAYPGIRAKNPIRDFSKFNVSGKKIRSGIFQNLMYPGKTPIRDFSKIRVSGHPGSGIQDP